MVPELRRITVGGKKLSRRLGQKRGELHPHCLNRRFVSLRRCLGIEALKVRVKFIDLDGS